MTLASHDRGPAAFDLADLLERCVGGATLHDDRTGDRLGNAYALAALEIRKLRDAVTGMRERCAEEANAIEPELLKRLSEPGVRLYCAARIAAADAIRALPDIPEGISAEAPALCSNHETKDQANG